MPRASDANRHIAYEVAETFGGRPRVARLWDEDETVHIDIAHVADSLWDGVTLYSTLGLSDTPLIDRGREHPARVEFIGVCESAYDRFGEILASAAFSVIKDHEFVYPGRIFPGVVESRYPHYEMKHLLFVSPCFWEGRPWTQYLPEKTVTWLQAVPISEPELRYAVTHGPDALEDLLEREGANVMDPERGSAA